MSEMSAVMLSEWGGELSVDTVTQPEPGPNEVRIAVRACAITRTVENAIQGGLSDDPSLLPRIPGHEFAGVIDAVGPMVSSVAPGDRVLSYFYLTCGMCQACRQGNRNQCTDFDGWVGVNCDGAYAEYATIPAANAIPIPDECSFTAAALAADGLATPLHVCERANITDSDTVLILGGAGRIGIHLSQLAASRGANVISADVNQTQLTHIDEMTGSAVETVDASRDDFADQVQHATSYAGGPTVIVDTVGDINTIKDAWDLLGMGGCLVTLTTHHDRSFAPPLKQFVYTETSLIGSRYATSDQVIRAAQMFADNRINHVVRDTVGLDEVPAIHAQLRAGETFGTTMLTPR